MQLSAGGLNIQRQTQPLGLQLANQPGPQAAAVGIKHPAFFRAVAQRPGVKTPAFGRNHRNIQRAQQAPAVALSKALLFRPHRQHAVQLDAFKALLQQPAPAAGHLRSQGGKLLAQRGQRRLQRNFRHALRNPETQDAVRLGLGVEQAVQLFGLPLNAQALLVNPVPGGGQGERPGLTLKQRHVEGLLQSLKSAGYRRLGNTEIFRGLIKRGELHGGQQCVNVVDAHSVLNVIFAY